MIEIITNSARSMGRFRTVNWLSTLGQSDTILQETRQLLQKLVNPMDVYQQHVVDLR
jgi:hypothetical protein